MYDMKWLLEPDVFQTDLKPFIAKLESLGIEHTVCQFGKSYEEQLEPLTDDHVFVGSMQFAKVIHSKRKWSGLYWNLPKFDCLYYYPRFKQQPAFALKTEESWSKRAISSPGIRWAARVSKAGSSRWIPMSLMSNWTTGRSKRLSVELRLKLG